jgi:hypothetical protein
MAGSSINFNNLISIVNARISSVSSLLSVLGKTSSGAQMGVLMKLQLAMNKMSMYTTTSTTLIQGFQDTAMSVSRNTKGS